MIEENNNPFLVLFEPEIAQNVGSLIRLSSCFQTKLIIIRPMAFIWEPKKLKRSAMDYINNTKILFFDSFNEFKQQHTGRIIGSLANNNAKQYNSIIYKSNDAIFLGKESTGLNKEIIENTDFNITIPIRQRSLNLSMAGAILLANATQNYQ